MAQETLNGSLLSSLQRLESVRQDASNSWARPEGSNLDVLSVGENSENGQGSLPLCHLYALLPFTQGEKLPSRQQFEEAAAITLAAHHLNSGDGSIVPQVQGLNETCGIRFTVEFADTEYTGGVALNHVIAATGRKPGLERLPCAFIGATRSAVSIPTSILTGLLGYPQVSGASTSPTLDDKSQYPLFGRTIPSDQGNAVPIIQFMSRILGITHLAVINVNDAYGNSFVEGLRLAAEIHAPDMKIHQAPVGDDIESIETALESIKTTQYRYVFAIIFTEERHDALMEMAYKMGLAGDGSHQWLFGDSFRGINNREFENNSPLHLAYRGVARIEATGGIPDIGLEGYDRLVAQLERLSNPLDLDYLFSIFPKHNETVYTEGIDAFEDFLTPIQSAKVPFMYEAVIALGLSACKAAEPSAGDGDILTLDGRKHYSEMVNSVFEGVNGDVVFDPATGSKDPSQTLYKVTNFVDSSPSSDGLVEYEEIFTHVYKGGSWNELHPFTFNDGTSTVPSDIPALSLEDESLSHVVYGVALVLCFLVVVLSLGFIGWTYQNRKVKVVMASQPFFLYAICTGTLLLGCAIIPLGIDHGLVGIEGCSIACIMTIWLMTLGFSVTVSALFTKTHRINIILKSSKRYQRIKVTIWDVAKPMMCLLGVNIIVLSIMTALAPSTYVIIVENKDVLGRPDEIRGQCDYMKSIPYLVAVVATNFAALLCTVLQAFRARNLSTEFAESASIFRALAAIVLVVFVGGPVLLLSRDNVNTFVFVGSALLFVISTSTLMLLFIPKIQHMRDHKRRTASKRNLVHVSGVSLPAGLSRASDVSEDGAAGIRILTTKTPEELVKELDELRQLLRRVEFQTGRPSDNVDDSSNRTSTSYLETSTRQKSSEEPRLPTVPYEDEELEEQEQRLGPAQTTTATGVIQGLCLPIGKKDGGDARVHWGAEEFYTGSDADKETTIPPDRNLLDAD